MAELEFAQKCLQLTLIWATIGFVVLVFLGLVLIPFLGLCRKFYKDLRK